MTTFLIGYGDRKGALSSAIWLSNGLLLAYLLLAPRWRWPGYLTAGFAGLLAANMLVHENWRLNLLCSVLATLEVLICALLLRRHSSDLPRFTDHKYLLRFLGFAILAGPITTGLIFALIGVKIGFHAPQTNLFLRLATGDSLGIAIVTPTCVAIFQNRIRYRLRWKAICFYLAPFVLVTFAAFAQIRVPLLFLIYPLLLLVLLGLDMVWAALAAFYVVAIGGWFTAHGMGPFTWNGSDPNAPASALTLQAFVAAGVFMLYSVSVILERQRNSERQLRKIVTQHNLLTENSRDVMIIADFKGRRSYVSPAAIVMGGWTSEELIEQGSFDLVHPRDLQKAKDAVQKLRSGCEETRFEVRIRRKDGKYFWAESCMRVINLSKAGSAMGILNIVRDISERKQDEQSQEFQHSLIRAIQDVSLDGVLVVDNEGDVVSLNKRFSEIWKLSETPESGQKDGEDGLEEHLLFQIAERVKDSKAFIKRIEELYADPDGYDESQIELVDGRTLERYSAGLRSEAGQHLGRVWFFRDISERKRTEQKLQEAYSAVESLAVTDGLTGLANRRHFDQYLTTEWRRSMREHSPLSLLMIDADFFKLFNDTYGHPRGDNCLKQIAEAAQDVVSRPGDLVARFGGEEFVVVLPNTDNAGAMKVATEICDSMSARRLPHEKNPFGIVTISVGCATMVPKFGLHAVNLIESADSALYNAKHNGRNQACNANTMEKPIPDSVAAQLV